MQLNHKVVILSGLGPGVGMAIVDTFAEQGAKLVLASRSSDHAEAAIRRASERGAEAIHVPTDITENDQCEALVKRAVEQFGGIDVLVNNAFASGKHLPIAYASIHDTWRTPFRVNVVGTMQMCQAVYPMFKRRGGGSIVMINTQSTQKVSVGLAAYAASKAALLTAAHSMALEWGPEQVRVNSVLPSHIDGPNLTQYFKMLATTRGVEEKVVRDEVIALGTLDHITTAEEVAKTALFFASDASSAITGQSLLVNCGQLFT